MSKIIQLYSDKDKKIKAYPKTLASQVYMDDGTTTINSQLETIVTDTTDKFLAVENKKANINETVRKGYGTLSDFDEPTRRAIQNMSPTSVNAVLGKGNVKVENMGVGSVDLVALNPSIFKDSYLSFTNMKFTNTTDLGYFIIQYDLNDFNVDKSGNINIDLGFDFKYTKNFVKIAPTIFINNDASPISFTGGTTTILNSLNLGSGKFSQVKSIPCNNNRYLKIYFEITIDNASILYDLFINNYSFKVNSISLESRDVSIFRNLSTANWEYNLNTKSPIINKSTLSVALNDSKKDILQSIDGVADSLNINYKFKDSILAQENKYLFVLYDLANILPNLTGSEKFNISFNINSTQSDQIKVALFNNNNSAIDSFAGGDVLTNLIVQNISASVDTTLIGTNVGNITNKYRYIRVAIQNPKFNVSYTSNLENIINNLKVTIGDVNLIDCFVNAQILNSATYQEKCSFETNAVSKYVRTNDFEVEKQNIYDKIDSISSDNSLIKLTDMLMPRYKEISDSFGFVGRWFEKDINGTKHYCTINSGSEFYFKVNGATSLSIDFTKITTDATPFFAYSVDGGAFVRQVITTGSIVIPNANEHIIRVVIDGLTPGEDKWSGEKGIALRGVTTNGTIKGILPMNKVGMFFGDSITEGVRNLNNETNANGMSSIQAFPFICCNKLNAITHRVGFASSGVITAGLGGVPVFISQIDNITGSRLTPTYYPDFIVINHGTNDSSADLVAYEIEYKKTIDRLTVKYSGVPIFVMIPFKQSHLEIKNYIANKPWCYLVDTNGWGLTYTDGLHPDINGSKIAGEKLADRILQVLGKSYFM